MFDLDQFNAVLFDLDGTIINPKEGIINSILFAAKEFDFKVDSSDSLEHFIGPPLHKSFQKQFNVSEEVSHEMIKSFRSYYAQKGIFECYLYEGINETIKKFHEQNLFLSLATSKPIGFSNQLLEHFHLDQYFSFTAGANLDGSRTDKKEVIQYALDNIPSFNMDEILMIGDREFDIIGGQHFNMKTAWAKWGYGEEKLILSLQPDYIFESPNDMFL